MWTRLDAIGHIERIRLHTRLPVVLPSRITEQLLETLLATRAQVITVVHANHAQEIADDCRAALRRLVTCGLPVLNQTVLLRKVNDTAAALEDLSLALINAGVMPYYLHQLDRVVGTAHFEVSEIRRVDSWCLCAPDFPVTLCRDWCGKSPAKTTRRCWNFRAMRTGQSDFCEARSASCC